jgi:hypothetical protein
MEKELEVLETGKEEQASRRVWAKPEAKAAEVAQATLAGGVTPLSDGLNSCSS